MKTKREDFQTESVFCDAQEAELGMMHDAFLSAADFSDGDRQQMISWVEAGDDALFRKLIEAYKQWGAVIFAVFDRNYTGAA